MKCREVRGVLVAYLDSEAGPSERRSVDAHIAECTACERELAALARTQVQVADSLRKLTSELTPCTTWSHLQAGIAAEGRSSSKATSSKPRSRVRTVTLGWRVAAAAFALILLAVGVMAAIPSSRSASGSVLTDLFKGLVWHEWAPLEVNYVPEGFELVYSLSSTEVPSGEARTGEEKWHEQTLYRNGELFVLIRVTSETDEGLPGGRAAEVSGNEAVLVTGLSGFVPPPAEMLVDDSAETTSTAFGGVEPPVQEPHDTASLVDRYTVTYQDATALTWVSDSYRVEVLSNLPVTEIQKIAEGMVVGQ